MKMYVTCSKVAHKSEISAVFALSQIFLSPVQHSFKVGYLGAL
jgi:hypothetical protein